MKRKVGELIFWWEGSGFGAISEESGVELGSSTASVCVGKVEEVDEENERYWVVEEESGRRVEMDDVSGHSSEAEARDAASVFWGKFPKK